MQFALVQSELSGINRLIVAEEDGPAEKALFFSSRDFTWEVKVPPSSSILGKANVASGTPAVTILFISVSAAQYNVGTDWAEAGTEVILRRCPICVQDSIVGHGRRRKQAHDEHHDWIGIRRGLCNRCGKTFTFLPPFSPPYGHYSSSLAARRYSATPGRPLLGRRRTQGSNG